jgi:hypothetical protein
VALVGLWLLARPYTGIRHDGVLYLGQIYLQIEPTVFANDLFFVFGSQDQFSLFSRLGAWAYRHLGLEGSQFAILLAGHLGLLGATALLLRPIADLRIQLLGLISLAVMPHYYGGNGVFSFAENFVTARTVSEPMGVLALALLIHGRPLAGSFAALLAALAHPLMALPVLAVGWAYLIVCDRRWAWMSLPLGLLVGSLAIGGVEPFSALTQRYDPAWLEVVHRANAFVYPLRWPLTNWALAVGTLVFLWVSAPAMPASIARLSRAVAGVAFGLLMISLVGTELLQNVLLTQLQLWRALWLSQFLALCLLPAVLITLWSRGGACATVAVCFGAAALALTADWSSSPAILAWAIGIAWFAKRQPRQLRNREWMLLHRASILMVVLLSALLLVSNLRQLAKAGTPIEPTIMLWALAASPLVVGAVCYFLLLRRASAELPLRSLAVVAMCLLLSGVALWDRRSEGQKIIEARPPQPHPFALKTAPISQVYWRDSLNHTWAMLGRASYFTDHQGSGVLFERGTAMEFERRRQLFAPLSFQREICMVFAGFDQNENWYAECVPDIELIVEICSAERGPDYLVFPFALARGAISSWTLSPPDSLPITYHLHDCKQLRG